MKLYEILDEILAIGAEIHEIGEVTPDLAEKLGAVKLDLTAKMSSIAKLIQQWDREADMVDVEIERLKNLAKRKRNQSEGLMFYVKTQLPQGTNFKTPLFTYAWRKSSAVEVHDETKIPVAYMRETILRSPDKKQIGDDLKMGSEIPGVSLVERYSLNLK